MRQNSYPVKSTVHCIPVSEQCVSLKNFELKFDVCSTLAVEM